MKIRIVNYDAIQWILSTMVQQLALHLRQSGCDVEIRGVADAEADINYHVNFLGWDARTGTGNVLMITHVDTADKLELLRRQLAVAEMGICLSADTLDKLVAAGLPRDKLCCVNFPSPQQGQIRRHKISIGIASRCYAHGSKRENLLAELASRIESGAFIFHIMGEGWDAVVAELQKRGSEVVWHPEFEPEKYRNFWQALDYYLYLGQDEGSTGYLDALEAGVPSIATPQGFHLDFPEGLAYAFNDLEGLVQIFAELAQERRRLREAVAHLNWPEYARKHLIIWREIARRRSGGTVPTPTHEELDSVGLVARPSATTASPWLAPMPASSGPGGAMHRPRLLLVADQNPVSLVGEWKQLADRAPEGLPMLITPVGAAAKDRAHLPGRGLEVVLLDYRSLADEDIVRLSHDFDVVGMWNCRPVKLLQALQRRSCKNFVLCWRPLQILGPKLRGPGSGIHVFRRIFLALIGALRSLRPATVVAFWTQPPLPVKVPGFGVPASGRSAVDAVIYTGPGWEQVWDAPAHLCAEVPPVAAGQSWEPGFRCIFEALHHRKKAEIPSIWLRLAKKSTRWFRFFKGE